MSETTIQRCSKCARSHDPAVSACIGSSAVIGPSSAVFPVPQPEPDAGGEWRESNMGVVNQNGRFVANCYASTWQGFTCTEAERNAEQIVSDHNAIPKLVVALEAAMKVVSDRAAGGRMLTTADEASAVFNECNAALALVKGRE